MTRLLPGAARKERNLTIRLTEQQHAAYLRAANASGARTLTEWITRELDAAAAAVARNKGRSK